MRLVLFSVLFSVGKENHKFMVHLGLVTHIRHLRSLELIQKEPLLERLSQIEKQITDFFSEEVIQERTWLIKSLVEERHTQVFNRILCPLSPNHRVHHLETQKNQLQQLVDAVQFSNKQEVQQLFSSLSEEIQQSFYWAVWFHFGAPLQDEFGKKALLENFFLLREIQNPILYLKGQNLVEQAFHYYAMHYAIEQQKNTIEILQKFLEKAALPLSHLGELRTLLQELPQVLQWKMYGDVYAFSSQRENVEKWGEYATLLCPRILLEMKDPQKKGAHLLEQYLQEYVHQLRRLQQMEELEEFERMTLLYRKLNSHQRQAFLEKVSPQVRNWIREMQQITHRRAILKADPRHLYLWRGAHPTIDGTQFQVFAPFARQVKVVLTAYGREEHCIPMERKGWGVWELFTPYASCGRTYRYWIEDCRGYESYRTDPFGFSVKQCGEIVESVVTDLHAYSWNDQHWMHQRANTNPLAQPLSIYEIHVDSWRKVGNRMLTWSELAWQLIDYHKRCPFTHVKFYGVFDHKNDNSWGFQVDHYFAPNRRLGELNEFKFLIDLCHQQGIGIIIDCPFAHFKHEHHGDRSQSLHEWDGTDHFSAEFSPWGTMYFDFGKEEAKRLIFASALYWLEMHVDGLVFDALEPMIFRNGHVQQSAIDFVKELNQITHEQYPGILTIAEYTGGLDNITRPVNEGGLGFDLRLAIYQQGRTRNYFRTPYEQRKKDEHHVDKLIANLNDLTQQERWLISHYHDDAAAGSFHNYSTIYGSLSTMDSWRRFADLRLFHAWNLLIPGYGHLIHMGDEIGQKHPWNERLHAPQGAVEWFLLQEGQESHFHRGLLEYVGDLNRLYRAKPAFWKLGQKGYRPISHDAPNQVIGFHRLDFEGGRLALFFNFSPMGYKEYDFPLPHPSQDADLLWIQGAEEIFNSDGRQYGGTGIFQNKWANLLRKEGGFPTHFRIALPPLSVVVFEERY